MLQYLITFIGQTVDNKKIYKLAILSFPNITFKKSTTKQNKINKK